MAKKNQFEKTRLTKKIVKNQILKTLETSLGDLQNALGEKKFRRRLKKVSKILSTGLPKAQKQKGKALKVKNINLPEQGEQKATAMDSSMIKPSVINEQA